MCSAVQIHSYFGCKHHGVADTMLPCLQLACTFQISALLGRPNSDREAAEVGAFDFGDLADSKMIIQMMTKAAMIPQGPRS